MKLTKGKSFVRETWLGLPELARWALLAIGRRPGTVTTGDLRSIREALQGAR